MHYPEFAKNYNHEKLSEDEVAKAIDDFIHWKQTVFSAQWKKEFFKNGCHNCGSAKLIHYEPRYEGRNNEWEICPTIWQIVCEECGNSHDVVTTDENDILTVM